jgi:hypothetical protein
MNMQRQVICLLGFAGFLISLSLQSMIPIRLLGSRTTVRAAVFKAIKRPSIIKADKAACYQKKSQPNKITDFNILNTMSWTLNDSERQITRLNLNLRQPQWELLFKVHTKFDK